MKHISWIYRSLPFGRALSMAIIAAGLCLSGILTSCRGAQKSQPEPYSPIGDGDSVEFIDGEGGIITTDEALEKAFGEDSLLDDEQRALKQKLKEKYRVMGDSLEKKLLKGERIH